MGLDGAGGTADVLVVSSDAGAPASKGARVADAAQISRAPLNNLGRSPQPGPMTRVRLFAVVAALSGCVAQRHPAPAGMPDGPGEDEPDAAVVVPRDAAPPRPSPDTAPPPPSPDAAPLAPDAEAPSPDAVTAPDTGTADGAPPVASGTFLVEGLDGDVTAAELDALIKGLSAVTIPTSMYNPSDPASHNALCEFGRGSNLEAMNLVYEVTREGGFPKQQRQLLDLAIRWSDLWLIHRNDLPLGEHRVMWTGKVDPIWPPNHPMDMEAAYAASETADTAGILAHTALNIVNTPALAGERVTDGDPNHLGATYLERARTYVAMLEVSMDKFFIPNFLDTKTLTIHHPSAPGYNNIPGTPGGSQNVNAWNRMMFFMHAFQLLGEIHHRLGDDARKDTMYRTVAENTVNAFVKNAVPHPAADGTTVYDWGYGNFGDIINHLSNEDFSHGQIDVLGLTRAQRSGYTSATAAQMKTYADTVLHEIRIAPNQYASTVNRAKAPETKTNYPRGWLTLSPYHPDFLRAVGGDMLARNVHAKDGATTAYLLWAKHRAAMAR